MNKKVAIILLFHVSWISAMGNGSFDYSASVLYHMTYDDYALGWLQHEFKQDTLNENQKMVIESNIIKIQEEYDFIQKYWSGPDPIKSLNEVSLNDVTIYFDNTKGWHERKMALTRYQAPARY